MTPDSTLYEVRSNTGLGGFVLGREAADELLTELGMRLDVLSVVATPFAPSRLPEDPTDAEALAYLGHGEQL